MNKTILQSLVALLAFSSSAYALDTTELFDPGLSDAEMYVSAGGLGNKAEERELSQSVTLGAGLTDQLSMGLTVTHAADGNIDNGAYATDLMLMATPVNTKNFDLDLFLTTSYDGGMTITPGVELNFDEKDDMSGFGVFVAAGVPLFDRIEDNSHKLGLDVEFTPGLYYTIADGQQILAGIDLTWHKDAEEDQEDFEIGEAHIAYNVSLLDNFELVTDFGIDIPQGDEDIAFSATIGFVATLPTGK